MADKDKKRKYLLFSSNDGRPSNLKPCAFFISPEGCKNGEKCKFSHSLNVIQDAQAAVATQAAAAAPAPAPVQVPAGAAKTKSEPAKPSKADNKRKHVEETPEPVRQSEQNSGSSNKKVKIEQKSELELLKEQVRKQQEIFEQKLAALATQPPAQSVVPQATGPMQASQPTPSKPKPKTKATPTKVAAPVATPSVASTMATSSSFHSQATFSFPISAPPPGLGSPPALSQQFPSKLADVQHAEDSSDDEKFLFGAVNHVLQNPQQGPSPQRFVTPHAPKSPARPALSSTARDGNGQESRREKNANGAAVFSDSASLLSTENPFLSPEQAAARDDSETPSGSADKLTFDISRADMAAVDWEKLVLTTASHKRYATDYVFDKGPLWVQARPAASLTSAASVIAIDCEMCECSDPVTGSRDKNCLIRLSVVNGLDPSQVFIDTLVATSLPIVDARTRIHGITEQQIQSAKYTLRHAQAALLNLITEDTIVVGHSVCNDLKALKLEHRRCVDTAYLCPMENESERMLMGLRAITEKITGLKLPETHDSVQDARAALLVAAYVSTHGAPTNLTQPKDEAAQLMLHRIPLGCTEEHLQRMILAYTHILPVKISPITHTNSTAVESTGKSYVTFSSAKHAELAFDSLTGPVRNDKAQRPQKRVYLKKGGYIYVRK